MWRCGVATILLLCLGCNSYNANLSAPGCVDRIEIREITANSPGLGAKLRDCLRDELSGRFQITNDQPDLVITGSAQWDHTEICMYYVSLELRANGTIVGNIVEDTFWTGSSPKKFAQHVKKTLTQQTKPCR